MPVSNQCALALDCNSPLRIFITGCSDFQDMGHLAPGTMRFLESRSGSGNVSEKTIRDHEGSDFHNRAKGAGVMQGEKNGVKKLLKDISPGDLLVLHCLCHRLELAYK